MSVSTELPRAYVLTGDAIYTMDPENPRVEAIGVIAGRIVAAGSSADVAAAMPPRAPRIDVGSRMVLPGFTDSHIHYGYLVQKWSAVDLDDCPSLEEALRRVKQYVTAEANAHRPWIDGHGWASGRWERPPTAAALDQVEASRPVALTGRDGHSLWINSAALAAAGITRDTPDPPGGVIEKDPESGEPTGVLYEDAMNLVLRVLPPMSPDEWADAMAANMSRLHAQGITAIHSPDFLFSDWRAYQRMRARGELTVRVTFMPAAARLDELIELGIECGFGDKWLRFGHLKIFADGTVGSRTAALLAPYEGEPDNLGVTVCGGDELKQLIGRAASHRIATAIHALGDRGVRETLDAIEHARDIEARQGIDALRHRIEHAQLVDRADIARFGRLGVVASMQPAHCPFDKEKMLRHWGRQRSAYASPFRSLADGGAVLAFGSDAPFGVDLSDASFSVLAGIYAALTRRWPFSDDASSRGSGGPAPADTSVDPDYAPNEVVQLHEALAAYTTGAAYVGGEDGWRGSLKVGHCADIAVLGQDLFAVSVADIPHVPVVATIVDGRLVHGSLPGV